MKRLICLTLASSALIAGTMVPVLAVAADAAPTAAPPAGLTRAEVQADLEAWERAGLKNKYRGDGAPPFWDPDLQRRLAEYQKLRAVPMPSMAPGTSVGG